VTELLVVLVSALVVIAAAAVVGPPLGIAAPLGLFLTLVVPGGEASEHDVERFARRITRGLANIEYFRDEPLGWREGTAVVRDAGRPGGLRGARPLSQVARAG
jgi:hypothetical protein